MTDKNPFEKSGTYAACEQMIQMPFMRMGITNLEEMLERLEKNGRLSPREHQSLVELATKAWRINSWILQLRIQLPKAKKQTSDVSEVCFLAEGIFLGMAIGLIWNTRSSRNSTPQTKSGGRSSSMTWQILSINRVADKELLVAKDKWNIKLYFYDPQIELKKCPVRVRGAPWAEQRYFDTHVLFWQG
jgi:hypothetical protein